MTDELKIKRYLERIGCVLPSPVPLTVETLSAIQYRHIMTVPYENLDILAGKPLSLDTDALYEKIVTEHRGGYCFEVNGLLGWLYRALGFDVDDCFARFLRGEPEIPMRRHRVLLVRAEGETWLCDVGIGTAAPRFPLCLTENTVQEQEGEQYRFTRDSRLGWVLWEYHRGQWREYISFTEEAQLAVDFVQPNFFCEKHPSSPFNKAPMLAIKTADGRKTIDGDVYKVFTKTADGDETVTCLEEHISEERYRTLLKTVFFITV